MNLKVKAAAVVILLAAVIVVMIVYAKAISEFVAEAAEFMAKNILIHGD